MGTKSPHVGSRTRVHEIDEEVAEVILHSDLAKRMVSMSDSAGKLVPEMTRFPLFWSKVKLLTVPGAFSY